jgi:hypothetical protein
VGVQADNLYFCTRSRLLWNLRESFATLGAFLDVYVTRPLPILGEPEPIFAER